MKLAKMPDGSPEIFHTLQGEGRGIGRPSVFVRSTFCNLHCHWCDTDYTWNWEGTNHPHERDADPSYRKHRREDQIIELDTGAIVAAVAAVAAFACRNFVFTGGEPLLQERGWVELMAALDASDPRRAHFEIETNGTLLPGEALLSRIDRLNVSPKLENSRVAASRRSLPETLVALAATGKADFKFVIGTSSDLDETLALVEMAGIDGDRVFLMPRALSLAELEANQGAVAAMAQEHGFRYSDRLHLRLYGAKRGV